MRFVFAALVGIIVFAGTFLYWPEYRYSENCDADPSNLRGCTGEVVKDKSTYRFGGGLRWVQEDHEAADPDEAGAAQEYAFQYTDALAASIFAGFIAAGLTGMLGGWLGGLRKRPPPPVRPAQPAPSVQPVQLATPEQMPPQTQSDQPSPPEQQPPSQPQQ
jgi:hypothetical protein